MSKNPLVILWAVIKGLLVEEGYAFVLSAEFYKGVVIAVGAYLLPNLFIQDWTDWRAVVGGLLTGVAVTVLNYIKSRRKGGTATLRKPKASPPN